MKFVIFFILFAFSSATQLTGWTSIFGSQSQKLRGPTYQTTEKEDSRKMAQQFTQQMLQEKLTNLRGQKDQEDLFGVYQQNIRGTDETVEFKNEEAGQLQNTIEFAVEAKMMADDVRRKQVVQGTPVTTLPGLHSDVFQARIQKLIDQCDEQEIEKEINRHRHRAQQLQYQQQFVSQQKQQIEIQKSLMEQQRASLQQVQQLEQVCRQLQIQESQLIQQQFSHQLAILSLQQARVNQAQKVQQDIVAENTREQAVQQDKFRDNFWTGKRLMTASGQNLLQY